MALRGNKALILTLVLMGSPLAGMGIDGYAPALPLIATDLHTTAYLVGLTMTTYLLGYGIGQFFVGILSDTFGRWKFLCAGFTLFILFSIALTLWANIYYLLGVRFLQGLAAASGGCVLKAVVTDIFDKEKIQKISIYMNITWGSGPIVAPFVGGYLVHYLNWHYVFYTLALYALLCLIIQLLALPETLQEKVTFSIKNIYQNCKTIISNKAFLGSAYLISVCYGTIVLFNIIGPFLIQKVLKQSSVYYGHTALFIGLAFILGSFSNRVGIKFFKPQTISLFWVCVSIIVAVIYLLLGLFYPVNIYLFIIPVFLIVYGLGYISPIQFGDCMYLFPKIAGSAMAILQSSFVIGAALMGIVGSFILSDTQVPFAITLLVILGLGLFAQLFWIKRTT